MASLLDQLYFDPRMNGGLLGGFPEHPSMAPGMFNPQTSMPAAMFAGGFTQPQLPPSAQPTAAQPVGPPMNIMPPAQLNAMQPQAPQQPGTLDRISDAIAKNPSLLMALGAGTMQGGFGKGLEMGARYGVLDKQAQEQAFKNNLTRQQMQSTLQFMKSRGVSDQDAALLLAQPEALKTWLVQNAPVQAPPSLVTVKTNGNETSMLRDQQGNFSPVPGIAPGPGKFEDISSMRKEYLSRPAIQKYDNSIGSYQSMLKSARMDTATADLDMIYGLAKLLDPESVVREGEFATVQKSQAIPDQIRGYLQFLTEGKGKLDANARKAIMDIAHNRLASYYGEAQNVGNEYRTLAQQFKFDPDHVVRNIPVPEQYVMPNTAPTAPATAPNGVIKWGRDKDGKPRREQK